MGVKRVKATRLRPIKEGRRQPGRDRVEKGRSEGVKNERRWVHKLVKEVEEGESRAKREN